MNKLEEIREKIKELRNQITEESKSFLCSESGLIFADYPDMKTFSWSQYTPYFNDGDECVFCVIDDPEINGCDYYGDDAFKGAEAYNRIKKLIQSVDAPTMKECFGDHVKVTFHRDGTTTTKEYSHD